MKIKCTEFDATSCITTNICRLRKSRKCDGAGIISLHVPQSDILVEVIRIEDMAKTLDKAQL